MLTCPSDDGVVAIKECLALEDIESLLLYEKLSEYCFHNSINSLAFSFSPVNCWLSTCNSEDF